MSWEKGWQEMIDDVESVSWAPGGIFGQGTEDAVEVLDEVSTGPYPDGEGGFREKPGLGNFLGAQDEVLRKRRQREERDRMLLVRRFLDELPDVKDWLLGDVLPATRARIVRAINPRYAYAQEFGLGFEPQKEAEQRQGSVFGAVGARARDFALEVLSEIYLRAYQKNIQRARAVELLGGLDPIVWAGNRAWEIVESPGDALRSIVARVKHVANAVTEPLLESTKAETTAEPEATGDV